MKLPIPFCIGGLRLWQHFGLNGAPGFATKEPF